MRTTEAYYSGGKYGNVDRCELINLTLNEDESGYYLSARFEVEYSHSLREFSVPKIRLPIRPDKVIISQIDTDWDGCRAHINLGFGDLPLEYGMVYGYRTLFAEKIIEEKSVEMSLDEIEKKLGHKIKIVNK